MSYKIENKNKGYYLPSIEFWIMDDLGLNLREAMLYKLILTKGYLIWNSEYIAKVLRCSSKSVKRDVQSLCDRDLIKKVNVRFGSRTRWILIAKYTENGERDYKELKMLEEQGLEKLNMLFNEGRKYNKRK